MLRLAQRMTSLPTPICPHDLVGESPMPVLPIHRFVALPLLALVLTAMNSPAADSRDQSHDQRMQSWWEDLEKSDPQASRSLLNFADKPDHAVAFFKKHLAPR